MGLIISSCTPISSDNQIDSTLVNEPSSSNYYTMINFEKGYADKCILDIGIQNKISEDQIKQLAKYIQENDGKGCSPLYIYYFLPDEKPGIDSAWAYSQFNPNLEVNINGLDLVAEATLIANTPEVTGKVLGIWLDTWAFNRTITITKSNGTYEMTTLYDDGSGETKVLDVKVVNGEDRLYESHNMYGDYMVVKNNGNLAFYDDQGFIYEIKP